jgi:hypothetical protein
MRTTQSNEPVVVREHMIWVQTRMNLDEAMMAGVRQGGALIAAGFGSFAFIAGLTPGLADAEIFSSPSRAFSLVANIAGMLAIAVATYKNRRMSAWVNADEFGEAAAPDLPTERIPYMVAAITLVIGIVSFVGLLLLR